MAPLPITASLHTLITRATTACEQPDPSACKPATPKSTIIIAAVLGIVAFLLLLLAFWNWGCLCCLSRKRYRRVSKDEETPGTVDVVTIGAVESASHVGSKGGAGTKTQAVSRVGGGHTGSSGFSSAFGGGGGGSGLGGVSLDCNVM